MSYSPSAVPQSIVQAINFLTRPLICVHDSATILSLQIILQSTLQAAYLPALKPLIILSLSPAKLPPRPILAACIASGVLWADWINALGNINFELSISARSVCAKVIGSKDLPIIIWNETRTNAFVQRSSSPSVAEKQVPISKLAQSSHRSSQLPIRPVRTVLRQRTLAQQLLESDSEEEAEIFAMISKTSVISPTPTRDRFPVSSFMNLPTLTIPSPVSSLGSASSDGSRPSSRSSSTFSFSPSEDSVTSVSSTTSSPAHVNAKQGPIISRPITPVESEQVFIDTTKKEVTRYTYQGGISTVLTGGVMLGGPPAAAKSTKPTTYKAPIGGKSFLGARNSASSNATTWRRGMRA